MNKKLIIIILVALSVSVGIIVSSKKEQNLQVIPIVEVGNLAEQKETAPTEPGDIIPSHYSMRIPFPFENFFIGDDIFRNSIHTPHGVLVFKESTDKEDLNSRNPTYDVLLDGVEIGEVGGQGFSQGTLSPDGAYYALRSRGTLGCAGICQHFNVDLIDVKNKKVIYVGYPPEAFSYEEGVGIIDNPYIESYTWGSNGAIRLVTFLTLLEKPSENSIFYRVTPKQVWNYDIGTKKYTLVETLPE